MHYSQTSVFQVIITSTRKRKRTKNQIQKYKCPC